MKRRNELLKGKIMADIRPCPFCGSKEIIFYPTGKVRDIHCKGCGADIVFTTIEKDDVIEFYNTGTYFLGKSKC